MEVGVAAINLASPLLILCQFSDSATYPLTLTKLMALNPCHVVYPASNLDPIMGASTGVKLYDDISHKLSNANLTPVHRRYYNEASYSFWGGNNHRDFTRWLCIVYSYFTY